MTIDKAIKLLQSEYERAKTLSFVNNPIAYALYKVWKKADEDKEKKEDVAPSPAEDIVPVVRCKDCKYFKESPLLAPNRFCFRLRGKDGEPVGYNFSDDDFCSRGERKDKNEN